MSMINTELYDAVLSVTELFQPIIPRSAQSVERVTVNH